MAGNGGVPEEFSGSSEERAIAVLDRIPGFDYEDGEFEESSEKESENLILSLGGSKRHGDGENSVVNLVKIVNQLPWRVFGNNYSEVPVLIISGEPMDESTISDEVKSVYNAGDGSSGFRPYFLHVTIPMISTDLIPIVSRNPELQAARAEKIAATTVNSLAELGEEQITRSPFMQRLANGFTTYKKIFVHNELWIDGQPRVCDNLFL